MKSARIRGRRTEPRSRLNIMSSLRYPFSERSGISICFISASSRGRAAQPVHHRQAQPGLGYRSCVDSLEAQASSAWSVSKRFAAASRKSPRGERFARPRIPGRIAQRDDAARRRSACARASDRSTRRRCRRVVLRRAGRALDVLSSAGALQRTGDRLDLLEGDGPRTKQRRARLERDDRGLEPVPRCAAVENHIHAIAEPLRDVLGARRAQATEGIRARCRDRRPDCREQRAGDRMRRTSVRRRWEAGRDQAGTAARFSSTSVSGPGQNCSGRALAAGGNGGDRRASIARSARARSAGRTTAAL